MSTFEDLNTAAQFREILKEIATEVFNELAPVERMGTVTAINAGTKRATVSFPDETGISVFWPKSIPLAVGSVVAVAGRSGVRHIDRVIGGTGTATFIGPFSISGAIDFTGAINVTGAITAPNIILTGANEVLKMATLNNYMAFYNGASRTGYLQGVANQIYLNADLAGASVKIRGVAGLQLDNGIANYSLSESVIGSRVVASTAAGYIYGNYFNMSAGIPGGNPQYLAGQTGSDNFLRWFSAIPGSWINGDTNTGAQYASTLNVGGWYYQQAFFSNPSTGTAGYGWHPGGVAGSLRMAGGSAVFHFNNTDGSNYYIVRGDMDDISSMRFKQDVMPWPPKANSLGAEGNPVRSLDRIRQLQRVQFKHREEQHMLESPWTTRRSDALVRLNNLKESKGEGTYQLPIHVCKIETCGSTPEDPCNWRTEWEKGKVGWIAEQVAEVAPEIVRHDEKGPAAINISGMMAITQDSVVDLDDDVQVLRERLATLEAQVATLLSQN